MKIAIMMRAIDQDSGFRHYIENLVEHMLRVDQKISYLLLYRTTKWLGRFASFKNAKEVLLKAPHKFIWDQVAVAIRAWKEGVDIIFNPKFSVPLMSHCPVAMGIVEPGWWVWPSHYEWVDRHYIKTMLPLYCRKSAHMFPVSNFVIDENKKYLGLPFTNTTIAYPAPKEYFRPMKDPVELEEFRVKYRLPERFILCVTRVDHPGLDKSISFHPGKNVDTTLRSFSLCRNNIPHKLVIAGRQVREYLLHVGWKNSDFEDIHFLGFVQPEEMPKLYNLAQLFILPSFYEGFGFTLVEAMACGCPSIASRAGACPEVGADAVLFADPNDPADFAEKIMLVIKNENVRQELKSKGLQRAAFFSWERTAKDVLEALIQVVEKSRNK